MPSRDWHSVSISSRVIELMEAWEAAGRKPTAAELCPDDAVLAAELASHLLAVQALDPIETPADAAPTAADPLPAPPGYRVLGEVARGGMGIVYTATDLTLDREVAIKTVQSGRGGAARFRAEAEVTSRLDHPGV